MKKQLEATYKGMQKRKSKHGGFFYYLFFEDQTGKRYKTMAYNQLSNFKYWRPLLTETRGCLVGGLRIKRGNLIDGNSKPVILQKKHINQFKMDV